MTTKNYITVDTANAYPFSPYVFGHNLEHTRGSIAGGLSAQMLRNRKFAGAVTRNEGCPLEWFGIGADHAFYDQYSSFAGADKSYTYTCNYPGTWKGRLRHRPGGDPPGRRGDLRLQGRDQV